MDYLISEVEGVMIRCLQKSITSSVSSVQLFLNEATETLTRHPQSVEDITLATKKHEEYLQKRSEVWVIYFKFMILKCEEKCFQPYSSLLSFALTIPSLIKVILVKWREFECAFYDLPLSRLVWFMDILERHGKKYF